MEKSYIQRPKSFVAPREKTSATSSSSGGQENDSKTEDVVEAKHDDDEALIGGKKIKKARITFRETHLLSDKGMWTLLQRGSSLGLKSSGKESIRHDSSLIFQTLRTWSKELFPKQHSSDTLAQIARWSGKSVIKNAMTAMRMELAVPAAQGVAPTVEKYREVSTKTHANKAVRPVLSSVAFYSMWKCFHCAGFGQCAAPSRGGS